METWQMLTDVIAHTAALSVWASNNLQLSQRFTVQCDTFHGFVPDTLKPFWKLHTKQILYLLYKDLTQSDHQTARTELTLFWQVVLFCLSLQLFAPPLDLFRLRVQQLHEPASVPPARRRGSSRIWWLGRRHGNRYRGNGFPRRRLQPGLGAALRTRGLCGGAVVLTVTEQALGSDGPYRAVLRGCAGLTVTLETSTELKSFILHERKTLQLQICLDSGRDAVGTLKPPLTVWQRKILKNLYFGVLYLFTL